MIIKQTHPMTIVLKEGSFHIASFSQVLPNVFSVIHKTQYRYSSPISMSKHLFRLQPEHNALQTVLDYKLSISADNAEVCSFSGAFGNNATFVEINEPYDELTILSEAIVSVGLLPRKMDLIHHPRTWPLVWMPWDHSMMQAYLQTPELPESELFALAEYATSFIERNKNDVFEVLKDMNETIHREYTYVPGVTTLFTTPYEVYISRKGVCQDFTNLLICLARLLGLAARYRVGYIYTGVGHENEVRSEASHAWAEIYLPYLGWMGFDPTNGCLADKNHIRVSSGRNFNDATPTSGTIFKSDSEVKETLTTSVKVTLLSQ